MDSLSQFALGAGISLAVLGPKIGPRRAVLVGGVLGTLPDLDVFLPAADPIDAFVGHRGWSHAFAVHLALTPVIGEALRLAFKGLNDARARAWIAVFLIFVTHALIDAITIYGTRLFWPFWDEAIGPGAVFIIDPLYTLPLLVPLLAALFLGTWRPWIGRWIALGLFVSTAYLGWALGAQAWMTARAERLFAERGIEVEALFVTPTPLNTLFWKATALTPAHYVNTYISVLGQDAEAPLYRHERGTALAGCLGPNGDLARLASFSDGFLALMRDEGRIVANDLRMGLTPNYAFRYALANGNGEAFDPAPKIEDERVQDGDWAWLRAGLVGEAMVRPAEAEALLRDEAPGATEIAC